MQRSRKIITLNSSYPLFYISTVLQHILLVYFFLSKFPHVIEFYLLFGQNVEIRIMFLVLQKFLSKPVNSAAFSTINLLLGSGPLIIPQPFFRAGFIFSTILTLIVFLISYNSAKYIGESIEKIGEHKKTQAVKEPALEGTQYSLAQNENSGLLKEQPIEVFGHAYQFTYLYGQKWKIIPVLTISIYLFGTSISKCIITGNILSKLLAGVPVVGQFYFWLSAFFFSGAAFSFKSIKNTRAMQAVFAIARFASIGLMLFGAIFIIIFQNQGIQDLAPKDGDFFINIQFLGNLFSSLMFAFMFHHSLPAISENLTKISQIKDFLKVSFYIAGSVMLVIPITAVMAFGNDLVEKPTLQDSVGGLIYYNEDFQGRLDFIYYIVSFYVFLDVAAFSILVIVIRKNLLAYFKPNIDPDEISKTTVTLTGVLLLLILVFSFALKNQIRVALSFTGGIFGCIILFGLPCMQVFKARKLFPKQKSFLNSYVWMPLVILFIGALSMGFNLYSTIKKLME